MAAVPLDMSPLQAILDVTAATGAGWAPLDLGRAFFDGGARVVQLRAKTLASGPFLALCDALLEAAAPYGATVVVNDRVDLARLAGAHGAHVGQDDLPPGAARRLLGAAAVVGYSTHTLAQVARALDEPVTYIAVGPVFGTRTKETGYDATGLELVREAARLAAGRPIVAIGGVTLDNAGAVLAAGATTVAVISDLLVEPDPARRVAAYLSALPQALIRSANPGEA